MSDCTTCAEYDSEKGYCPKYCEVIRKTLDELAPSIKAYYEQNYLVIINDIAIRLDFIETRVNRLMNEIFPHDGEVVLTQDKGVTFQVDDIDPWKGEEDGVER